MKTNTFENEHLTRQLDIIPTKVLGQKITVIGAGAIGSWTTLALAKMGFQNITVIDFDKVDTVNLNSQFFRFSDVGKSKVAALRDLVYDFTGVTIGVHESRYEAGTFPGIVISAVDSMQVRELIWNNHLKKGLFTKAIIDPRMAAEHALLYVMNPMNDKDNEAYQKSLYSDKDAVQERCTAKATIYTANLISGLVVKAVKDLVTTENYLRLAIWNIQENQLETYVKH